MRRANKIILVIIVRCSRATKQQIHKQYRAALRHPHHYVNACFLSVWAVIFGELKISVVGFFWLYAVGENFFEDVGEKKQDGETTTEVRH